MLAGPRTGFAAQLLHRGDGLVVAELGPVCVAIWREPATRRRFESQRAGLAEVIARHPEGAGFLCVIEKTSTPPDEELRKASSEMVASHGPRLRCVACVIEAAGFSAAIIRGVLTGMTFLLPSDRAPTSFFGNTRDAVEWSRRHVPIGELDTFMVTLQDIRSELGRPLRPI